jgi:hypothetical protein
MALTSRAVFLPLALALPLAGLAGVTFSRLAGGSRLVGEPVKLTLPPAICPSNTENLEISCMIQGVEDVVIQNNALLVSHQSMGVRPNGDRRGNHFLDLVSGWGVVFQKMANFPLGLVDGLAELKQDLVEPTDHHPHWILPNFRTMQIHQVISEEGEKRTPALAVDFGHDIAQVGDALHEVGRLGWRRGALGIKFVRGG